MQSRSTIADALLVGAGGAAGVLARAGISYTFPPVTGWPWPTFICNIAGAFLLGALIVYLPRRIDDPHRRRILQLTFGTGLLGGFTTYSALAYDSFQMMSAGSLGIAYIVVSVALGIAAAWAGMRFGRGVSTGKPS